MVEKGKGIGFSDDSNQSKQGQQATPGDGGLGDFVRECYDKSTARTPDGGCIRPYPYSDVGKGDTWVVWRDGTERVESKQKGTGFVKTTDEGDTTKEQHIITEKHWGPKPEDNYEKDQEIKIERDPRFPFGGGL